GNSQNDVTITYDAYGTLIMPDVTYTNVVRIKEDYGNSEVDYQWYILDPLIQLAIFDHNDNRLNLFRVSQSPSIITVRGGLPDARVFPNPASDRLHISNVGSGTHITIADLPGRTILRTISSSDSETLDISALQNGIYVVQMEFEGKVSAQKIVVNR